jgi:hypothetical protein
VLADLRMQFVDDPNDADFVLVDDLPGGDANACPAAAGIKSIRLADGEMRPDVTVSVDDGRTPDYRVYVNSAQYSRADAAALLAVMWKDEGRRRHLAARDYAYPPQCGALRFTAETAAVAHGAVNALVILPPRMGCIGGAPQDNGKT